MKNSSWPLNFTRERNWCEIQEAGYDLQERFISACVTLILSLTASVGNLLICLAILNCRNLRNDVPGYFMLSLALADLLVGCAVQPIHAVTLLDWSQKTCHLEQVKVHIGFFCCAVSTGSIMAVCIDRWLMICKPYRYTFWVTKSRVATAIAFTWICGLLISVASEHFPDLKVFSIATCLWLMGAAAVAAKSCLEIYAVARHQIRQIALTSVSLASLPTATRERKLAISLTFVVAAYLACWLPFSVVFVFVQYMYNQRTWHVFFNMRLLTLTLGYSNSSMNVLIYSLHNKQMTQAIVNLFRKRKTYPDLSEGTKA